MALKIIRGDIVTMECDAIVNATNRDMYPSGGVDLAIHKAAGDALFRVCQTLGGLDIGAVKITPGFKLPCRIVIHTVGPRWLGGDFREEELLRACYVEALRTAKACKCESIAFPLISSGLYGYPKDSVLQVALAVFKEFLEGNEMQIYLVIYDKEEYDLNDELKADLAAYLDKHYVEDETETDLDEELDESLDGEFADAERSAETLTDCKTLQEAGDFCVAQRIYKCPSPTFDSEENLFKDMYDVFSVRLLKFIDEKGMDDVECYKKANVSKQTWYKILNEKGYKPSKKTVISFAIALHLNIEEAQSLLASAGFILSKSSRFDVIIMYCITKKIYDIFDVEAILFHHLQETLGGK